MNYFKHRARGTKATCVSGFPLLLGPDGINPASASRVADRPKLTHLMG